MNRFSIRLYRRKTKGMKSNLYIVFFIGCTVTFGQPPVERNNAVTNSIEVETPINEIEDKEIFIQQSTAVQTINDFFELHSRANSLPGQKNPTAHQQRQMNDFVKQSQRENANSFESNLSIFMSGNYDVSKKSFLDKAKELQPANYQVLVQSVSVSYILSDNKTLVTDLKTLKGQKTWSANEFDYAKDILTSVPQNGILITHGTNDSYPVIYQQFVNDFRKDIQVISMPLLQSEAYRNKLAEAGLRLPGSKTINAQFIKDFCKLNEQNQVYLSLTIPQQYFTDLEQHLYPVGLTFRYSVTAIQNSEMNVNLWNRQLGNTLRNYSDSEGKQLSANYLPLLMNLYKYYESEGNTKQLTDIKNTIRQIGKNIGNNTILKELGLNE